ncbi:DNA polymerase III subunit delta [Miniphocaeibacter massiliensis]|uniref:DNA polymerase III subunit delta n=1 Tax=Miniphocaeibacter massiliensis TaxID=2041841 RepID=UPI0013EC74CE|nr:DNA polymerase III subunit delta [Miniphocaeibacter massiliensis]
MNNIFLFYGEEKYIINELNESLINEKLNINYIDFNLIKIDSSKFSFNLINQNLETLPFFDESKIVIVDNLDLTKNSISSKNNEFELLTKYLDNIPTSSILIINSYNEKVFKGKLYKKIEKVGEIKNIKKLNSQELFNYIYNKLVENKVIASKKVINYIIDKSAYLNKDLNKNLFDLNNELVKIYKNKKNSEVLAEDIDELFTNSFETNIFKLTDAISGKKSSEAMRIYFELINNSSDPFQIFYMVLRTLRNILIVKECERLNIKASTASKKYSISTYEINKIKSKLKYWKYNEIKRAFHLSYETEVELKSSSIKPELTIEKYILNTLK